MSDLDDYRLDPDSESGTDSDPGSGTDHAGPAGHDEAFVETQAESSELRVDEGLLEEPVVQQRSAPRSPPVGAILAILLGLVAAAALYYWFFGRAPEPPATEPVAESGPPASNLEGRVEEEPIEDEPVPELGESDVAVRRLVGGLTSHPQLAAWLIHEDLARRFVAAIDNIAEGDVPRPHVGFLQPSGSFEAAADGAAPGHQVITAGSFRRYDLLTDVFTSLDTEGTAELYRRLKPLLNSAYADLGYPNRDFDDRLGRALRMIRETPRPPRSLEVVPKVASYEFADPRLEALPPLQKQLLRLGPENLERIQTKAAALARAIGVD